MFERTRGFESHSPRLINMFIHYPFMVITKNPSIGHRQLQINRETRTESLPPTSTWISTTSIIDPCVLEKINHISRGLKPYINKVLKKMASTNIDKARILCDYLIA